MITLKFFCPILIQLCTNKQNMDTDKLRIAHLILVIIIASQGIFYLLGASEAFRKLSTVAFAEQRRLLDGVIASRFRFIYLLTLATGLLIIFLTRHTPQEKTFICTLAATLLLIADIIVALKGNIPVNNMFSNFSPSSPSAPADWHFLQVRWISCMVIRGIYSTISLLIILFSFYK